MRKKGKKYIQALELVETTDDLDEFIPAVIEHAEYVLSIIDVIFLIKYVRSFSSNKSIILNNAGNI